MIGVLTPYTSGYYYGAIVSGIQRVACARGAIVVAVQTTGMDLAWPDEPGDQYLGMGAVDGWIAVNEFASAAFLERIRARELPLVYVHERPQSVACCAVLPDNHSGMKEAVLHLIEHGHRRIGFAGFLGQLDLRERYEGYLAAHHEADIEIDPELFFPTPANLEMDGRELGKKLHAAGMPCTAMVAGTDKLVLGVMETLRALGLSLPRDLALIGFDDIDKAQHVDPPLTTVKQSFGLVAGIATETLLDHLALGVPLPETVRVPTAFVQRRSCGCSSSYSLAPAPSAPPQATPEEVVTEALLTAAGAGQLAPVSAGDWPGAVEIGELLVAVAQGRPRTAAAEDLGALWTDFLELNRDAESIDRALMLLERAVERVSPNFRSHEALQILFRDLRVALMRSWRRCEIERNRYYEFVAEANAKINHTLAVWRPTATLDLSWLRWTRVKYACLGLWSQPDTGGGRSLRVAAEYGDAAGGGVLGTGHEPNHFPPREICNLTLALGRENVLTLVPLTCSRGTRGVLAVVAPIEVELLDHGGNVGDWAAQVGAALERAEVDQQLRKNAFHDALTGLPNRALLMDRLEELNAADARLKFAVLFLDLDDFKKINDGMGHEAGDQLLVEIGRRLSLAIGDAGMVARLGGDEFAIIIADFLHESDVLKRATTIQNALRAPFVLNGVSIFISSSIGVAFSGKERGSAAELLRDADTAMYRAKLQGRARFEVFQHGMHTQAVERLRLDSRLRQALEQGEFTLVYQPIVSLATGRALGAEALIRWNHPEQGCLTPGRFLAVAEEVGLGIPISEWVIATACRQALTFQRPAGTPLYVNVNVSAEHLQASGFVEFVQGVLAETGLRPEALGIELVESSLADSREVATSVLGRFIDMGVRVAIDDFGTGYSSLSYLKNFPVSVLKIDGSFVQGLPGDPRDTAITNAIITMGRGLGLSVVAEGVETEQQLEALRHQGCDAVQGYFISRPIDLEACKRFLLKEPSSGSRRPPERARISSRHTSAPP